MTLLALKTSLLLCLLLLLTHSQAQLQLLKVQFHFYLPFNQDPLFYFKRMRAMAKCFEFLPESLLIFKIAKYVLIGEPELYFLVNIFCYFLPPLYHLMLDEQTLLDSTSTFSVSYSATSSYVKDLFRLDGQRHHN